MKTYSQEVSDYRSLLASGAITPEEFAEWVKEARARHALTATPAAAAPLAETPAAAAAPLAEAPKVKSAKEVDEQGVDAEEELPTPWGIMELPSPVTPKTGKIDTSRLASINLRAVEKGEYIDGKDPKTGKAKKVWKGSGKPSGMIALDVGNQWKNLIVTPIQMRQFIKAVTAINPETRRYLIEEAYQDLIETSQPQTLELS
jgi:hypothetical protein